MHQRFYSTYLYIYLTFASCFLFIDAKLTFGDDCDVDQKNRYTLIADDALWLYSRASQVLSEVLELAGGDDSKLPRSVAIILNAYLGDLSTISDYQNVLGMSIDSASLPSIIIRLLTRCTARNDATSVKCTPRSKC